MERVSRNPHGNTPPEKRDVVCDGRHLMEQDGKQRHEWVATKDHDSMREYRARAEAETVGMVPSFSRDFGFDAVRLSARSPIFIGNYIHDSLVREYRGNEEILMTINNAEIEKVRPFSHVTNSELANVLCERARLEVNPDSASLLLELANRLLRVKGKGDLCGLREITARWRERHYDYSPIDCANELDATVITNIEHLRQIIMQKDVQLLKAIVENADLRYALNAVRKESRP